MNKSIKSFIINFIIIIFIIICLFSLYKIIKYKIDENKIKDLVNDSFDKVIINEIPNKEDMVIESNFVKDDNPYWDYINMNLIDVDFSKLKSINSDIKGFIQLKGTSINYPFVQGDNNSFYLKHSIDKSYNIAGWIFLDYRNDLSNSNNNKNMILYAHGMNNETMFGSLRYILESGWLNNSKDHVIKLSTEYESSLWQVFSVYRIKSTNDYIKTDFKDNEFSLFTDMLIKRSYYNFNTDVLENDRILTLSTCYNKKDKIALHAKLIKREIKK